MNLAKIENSYALAKERYAAWGVDTDAAMEPAYGVAAAAVKHRHRSLERDNARECLNACRLCGRRPPAFRFMYLDGPAWALLAMDGLVPQ
jgi:hypothetical protein